MPDGSRPAAGGLARLVRRLRNRARRQLLPARETVHFLHINKNAGTQLRHVFRQTNEREREPLLLQREKHRVTLADIPADARYFFSIRDPVSRFKSGFYCRKRKGRPHYNSEWTPFEAIAFRNFEHANDLAEALFRPDERGRQATAAIRSIVHLAKNQVDWFPLQGAFLVVRPPVWIIRTEAFEADLATLFDRLGMSTEVTLADDPETSHSYDYARVPDLSELARENLRRWYAQDYAFCAMCHEWLDRETAARPANEQANPTTELARA